MKVRSGKRAKFNVPLSRRDAFLELMSAVRTALDVAAVVVLVLVVDVDN